MHTDTSAGGPVVGPVLSGTTTGRGRMVLEGLHHCWVGSWASHGLLRVKDGVSEPFFQKGVKSSRADESGTTAKDLGV